MIASLVAFGKKSFPKTASHFSPAFKCFTKTNYFSVRLISNQIKSKNSQSKENSSDNYQKKYRKKYVEVESPFAQGNRPLYALPSDPHGASKKILKILDQGSMTDAYDFMLALPIRLQSEVVWNHLINRCVKEGRAKLAEKMFVEMRNRGMSPNSHTFTHMILVYSKSKTANPIEKAEEWIKKMKSFGIKPSIIHLNSLLMVYNHAQQPSKTIELIENMPTRGINPDATTYTIGLKACSCLEPGRSAKEIRRIWQSIEYRLDGNILEKNNGNMEVENLSFMLDDDLIISLVTAISRTSAKESDILPGLEAIHRLYSLLPGTSADLIKKHQLYGWSQPNGFGIQPSVNALDSILRFCGRLKQYTLGREFYELALQQYPKIEPDSYVISAYKWLQKMDNIKPYKKMYKKKNLQEKEK